MNEAQRACWVDTLAACPPGLLRRIDTAVVIQFCVACTLYVECAQAVGRDGYEVRGHRGARLVSPAVHTMNAQSVIMRQCIAELGFSPAARTRINMQADVGAPTGANDSWAQLAMNY
jgi:P27 family predicted phage terminase small subunit